MNELDRDFVEYVVKALVDNPEDVKVERSVDDMGVLLELTVNPADMGKVIGRAGATAKSIRTLLRVVGSREDLRVNLKIVEPEGSEGRRGEGEGEAAQPAGGATEVSAGGAGEGAGVTENEGEQPTREPAIREARPEPRAHQESLEPKAPERDASAELIERTKREFADLDDLDI